MKSLLFAFSLLISLNIFAEDNKEHPCREDVKKFCSHVEKGEGRIAKCLKEHKNELSSTCKEKTAVMKEKMHAKMKDMKENCKEDMEKLCKDVKAGKGAKIKCLKEKKDQTSDKCKAVL